MSNEMNYSGSNRDKRRPTPKQNKRSDPFYCEARRLKVDHRNLFNHKEKLSRDHAPAFFSNLFKRKVIK